MLENKEQRYLFTVSTPMFQGFNTLTYKVGLEQQNRPYQMPS